MILSSATNLNKISKIKVNPTIEHPVGGERKPKTTTSLTGKIMIIHSECRVRRMTKFDSAPSSQICNREVVSYVSW